jgi:tRNA threonylcarbamoyladenosine biosynthesis protein TsaB
MMVLGIETSTAVCSVGLARRSSQRSDGQPETLLLLAERSIVESHIHSEKLLTLIQELCDEQNIKLSQLDGIAVSIGPGSFTGLRIGLSTAKGLCFALERPLLAVPTCASIAQSIFFVHPVYTRVAVCIDAKQREYYIGTYEQKDGRIQEVSPVHIGSISEMLQSIDISTLVVTDKKDTVRSEVADSIAVEDVFPYCRGDVIARMALERCTANHLRNWNELEPLYLKDFVIRKHHGSD